MSNNPIKYVDPTGHCEGTLDEHDTSETECWNEVVAIEAEFSFARINAAQWTTKELRLLKSAMRGYSWHAFYPLMGEVPVFTITFARNIVGENSTQAGLTTRVYGGRDYTITIYDYAWFAQPCGCGTTVFRWNENFQGTIAHELTHVAIAEDPTVVSSYQASYEPDLFFQSIGTRYDFEAQNITENISDPRWAEEMIAMTVAAYTYQYSALDGPFSKPHWSASWVDQIHKYLEE